MVTKFGRASKLTKGSPWMRPAMDPFDASGMYM